jgi:membrane protein YdbS with pleckstrin-like domain
VENDQRPVPLDPRVIPFDRTVGAIVTAVVGFLLFISLMALFAGAPMSWWARGALVLTWIIATAVCGWWTQRWPAIAYRYASYRVDADGIEIRDGVLWRTVTNVPRSRVQHTDVSQGPLQRKYGLGTLVIHTAGTDHATVQLRGLDHGRALAIRDHLLPRQAHDAV